VSSATVGVVRLSFILVEAGISVIEINHKLNCYQYILDSCHQRSIASCLYCHVLFNLVNPARTLMSRYYLDHVNEPGILVGLLYCVRTVHEVGRYGVLYIMIMQCFYSVYTSTRVCFVTPSGR